MMLNEKESRQVVKLLRLALDARGSDKQADLAAAKAFAICRARGISLEDLGDLIWPTNAQPNNAPSPWLDVQTRFGQVFAENLFAEVDDLLESLRPKRRARA